jgi:hypothetical protein
MRNLAPQRCVLAAAAAPWRFMRCAAAYLAVCLTGREVPCARLSAVAGPYAERAKPFRCAGCSDRISRGRRPGGAARGRCRGARRAQAACHAARRQHAAHCASFIACRVACGRVSRTCGPPKTPRRSWSARWCCPCRTNRTTSRERVRRPKSARSPRRRADLSARPRPALMLAFAQLSRPAPQAVRPAPARGAARLAAPQRPPAARFSRLVAAAKRDDDRFDSVFTSRSDAALAYVCVDCGCVGAAERNEPLRCARLSPRLRVAVPRRRLTPRAPCRAAAPRVSQPSSSRRGASAAPDAARAPGSSTPTRGRLRSCRPATSARRARRPRAPLFRRTSQQ